MSDTSAPVAANPTERPDRCAICGAKFGIWSRLNGQRTEGICQSCQDDGFVKAEAIAKTVDPANVSGAIDELNALGARYHLHAEQESQLRLNVLQSLVGALSGSNCRELVKEFDEASTRLHVPDAAIIRRDLLRRAIDLISNNPSMSVDDVTFASELVGSLKAVDGIDDSVRESAARISKRMTIETWTSGNAPHVDCAGLLLKKGEVCHWEEPARLYEQKTQRQYAGVSQGISIPLGHGFRYRVGAFKGTPIDRTYLSDCGAGKLHVTSARICFTGDQQSVAIDWPKVINISLFSDGFSVHRTGAKKPTFIQVGEPGFTMQILSLAGPNSGS